MKKCPYCAEKIQDEAIVCRYCGRDLPPDGPGNEELTRPNAGPAQARRSSWRTGAVGAGILTVLYLISTVLQFLTMPVGSPLAFKAAWQDLIGRLTLGLAATFLVFWLICASAIWLWQRLGAAVALLIYALTCGIVIAAANALALLPPALPLLPASTHTISGAAGNGQPLPLLTPPAEGFSNCRPPSDIGRLDFGEECVYGVVLSIQTLTSSVVLAFERSSRVPPDSFYLATGNDYDVKTGDCVMAWGSLVRDDSGQVYMPVVQLYSCPLQFRP